MFRPFVLTVLLCMPALAAPPTTAPGVVAPHPYLLHLPGVSGESVVDHTFVDGLKSAHFDADIEIYDWTENDPGVPALQATKRNIHEAELIAAKLTAKYRADPRITIYVTSHSGGAGLAVGSLARLPADVKVHTLLLLAPALSPEYNLTKALSHVQSNAYAFYSNADTVVLSVGTRAFGTIDGVHCDAAGLNGFVRPTAGDVAQYQKLIQFPYDSKWAADWNSGDHIGPMATPFVAHIIAPLLEHGPAAGATTRPAPPAAGAP